MGGEVSTAAVASKIQKLHSAFLFYQKNPDIWPKRIRMFGWMMGSVAVAGAVVAFSIGSDLVEIVLQATGAVLFILGGFLFAMLNITEGVKKDMTKLLIAEKNGWMFDPELSIARLNALQKKFPILRRGGGKGIDDQYWGTTEINGKQIDFWMALHHYEVKQGKHTSAHVATLMAFRLPRPAEHPFYIREGVDGPFTFKKDIQLESVQFNDVFIVKYVGEDQTNVTDLLRILTPATQQRFVELAKKFDYFNASFSGDAVLFSLNSDLLTPFEVSVFDKFEVNPRDEQLMHERMAEMFNLAGEIIKFVD